MANTRDLIGEQETLDGLVSHSLDNLEEDGVIKLRSNAFRRNSYIKKINLPNLKEFDNGGYTCELCYNLEKFIGNNNTITIPTNGFCDCGKLKLFSFKPSDVNSYGFASCSSLSQDNIDISNIRGVYGYSLTYTGFGTLDLPNAYYIDENGLYGQRLSTINLGEDYSSRIYFKNNSYSLVHVIIKNKEKVLPVKIEQNALITSGLGWVYVDSNLVDSYKNETNWVTIADQIVSLDEYPKALSGETITDSWDEIFQAESDGSYKTKYSVGDTKYLVIGGTYVLMQIIAFDRDILSSDHASTAKITWLAKGVSFQFSMNFENVTEGGWADCECRKFLSDTIYEQIPENVRNRILAVDKTYTATSSSSSTATVSDKLWIPSAREMFGGSSYENSGVDYTDFFIGNSDRLKYNGLSTYNNASYWYLRSVYGSIAFRYVNYIGSVGSTTASTHYGVVLGFCT